MKLAIILTAGFGSQNVHTARRLAEAALEEGHQVALFLMNDGVYQLSSFGDLQEKGLDLSLCAHNAYQRGLEKVDGVLFGSQYDWAQAVNEADRVVALG
ncbi:MAG: DsrE family protein [Dehalococcoidia bacterium]|nr:DsrE family protein [Dehalococcoidia bacterium]